MASRAVFLVFSRFRVVSSADWFRAFVASMRAVARSGKQVNSGDCRRRLQPTTLVPSQSGTEVNSGAAEVVDVTTVHVPPVALRPDTTKVRSPPRPQGDVQSRPWMAGHPPVAAAGRSHPRPTRLWFRSGSARIPASCFPVSGFRVPGTRLRAGMHRLNREMNLPGVRGWARRAGLRHASAHPRARWSGAWRLARGRAARA